MQTDFAEELPFQIEGERHKALIDLVKEARNALFDADAGTLHGILSGDICSKLIGE